MPQQIPVSPIDSADRFGIIVAQWHKAVTTKLLRAEKGSELLSPFSSPRYAHGER